MAHAVNYNNLKNFVDFKEPYRPSITCDMRINFNNFLCDPLFCEEVYLDDGDFIKNKQ